MPPYTFSLAGRSGMFRVGHSLLIRTFSHQNLTLSQLLIFVSAIILSSLTSNPHFTLLCKDARLGRSPEQKIKRTEGGGFEPPVALARHSGLANRRTKPGYATPPRKIKFDSL